MSTMCATAADMSTASSTMNHGSSNAGARRAYAEMLIAAAVDDYRELLPLAQRQRLLLICKEALDSHTDDVERLAGDLLRALCPDVPDGVRASLAWVCGDIAERR